MTLRELDACLHELEDANEREEVSVSPRLARRLQPFVPWLFPGMLLTEAIEGVFKEQEGFLHRDTEGSIRPKTSWDGGPARVNANGRVPTTDSAAHLVEPLGTAEARALTERIKTEISLFCMLLVEAHERRAWLALGYGTWQRYVRQEFGMGRSRSYQILDQGRVLRAIQAAAGLPGIPILSAYAAGEIKFQLDEVIDEIRLRMSADQSQDGVRQIVDEVVQTKRRQIAARREDASHPVLPAPAKNGDRPAEHQSALPQPVPPWPRGLGDVVEFLATLPPPALMIEQLTAEEADRLTSLERAVQWLTDFAGHYVRARSIALREKRSA